jgi:hypothetical protein
LAEAPLTCLLIAFCSAAALAFFFGAAIQAPKE